MNKRSIISIVALFALTASALHATEARDIRLSTIRQKAMGGVSVATAKTDAALFQNPAGLNRIKRHYFKLPRIQVGVRKDVYEVRDELSKIFKDDVDTNDKIRRLNQLAPLKLGASIELTPLFSYTKPNDYNSTAFALAGFASGEISGRITSATDLSVELTGGFDAIPTVGFARYLTLFDRRISVGAAFKYISRNQVFDKRTGSDVISLNTPKLISHFNDIEKQKIDTYALTGFGADLGFLVPIETLNSYGHWGMTFRNIGASLEGSKELESGVEVDDSQQLPFTAAAGVELDKPLPIVGEVTLAADYTFVSPDTDFEKNLHMGLEKNFLYDRISLRGGLNQGFIVGGLGLSFYLVHVDYAFYAEELGKEIGLDSRLSHVLQVGVLF